MTCVGFLVAVAGLVAQGGTPAKLAYGLLCLGLAGLAFSALRYFRYPHQLRRTRRLLSRRILKHHGELEDADEASALADRLFPIAGDPSAVHQALLESGLPEESAAALGSWVAHRVAPLLARPSRSSPREATRLARLACEFRRSFVLAFTTLVWFLLVPVPGVLIFTAGHYQAAISITPFINALAGIIAVVLIAALAGLLVERLCHLGPGKRGLRQQVRSIFRRFRSQELPDFHTSSIYALFTDLQTYLDQRAYAYARRTLSQIEGKLRSAEPGQGAGR